MIKKGGLPFLPQHRIREEIKVFPRCKAAAGTFGNNHVDMRIPLQVTAESMEGTDDSRGKGFLMIEGVHPIGNNLSSGLEENIKKLSVTAKKFTEFLRNRKDNVPVAAVDELCGNGIGTICLIGGAAGIAEAGFAAERHKAEVIAVRTAIQSIALFQISAMKHFFNLGLHNRTNASIGRGKRGPVILKNLLDGKLCTHSISPSKF